MKPTTIKIKATGEVVEAEEDYEKYCNEYLVEEVKRLQSIGRTGFEAHLARDNYQKRIRHFGDEIEIIKEYKNMKEGEYIEYNGYYIYLNYWEEYCVLDMYKNLLAWNSSSKTLDGAKKYIDNLDK